MSFLLLRGALARILWALKPNNGASDLPSQTSVFSLTGWSSRRPQAPLAGALRASHSGAAYRGR